MTPSDTFITSPPHWGWLVILYFFFGGLSAGSFVLAAILDLFGKPSDRPLARIGYLVAFPALALCPPLLILDLDRPERFWHMLLENHTLAPMFKAWSPMSVGSWGLAIFGVFVTAAFLGAAAEGRSGLLGRFAFLGRGGWRKALAALGVVPGFFVAGYTGVLLAVTNRPIWADSPMLGAVFLLSAAGGAAALLAWLGKRARAARSSIVWLERLDVQVAVVELVALAAMLVLLGPVARVWLGVWGVLLGVAVVVGLVIPVFLRGRPAGVACALTLAGGLLLRAVMILSSEGT